jgi:hypothetical protein
MNTCTTSIQHPNTPFGYASISYREADYLVLSGGIPFAIPVHPGALLVIPANATNAMRDDLTRNYNDQKAIWANYHAVESALKRLVLEAVNIDWFSSLMHPTHRLALVTCRQMITHLWENFGVIDELDLSHRQHRQTITPAASRDRHRSFVRSSRTVSEVLYRRRRKRDLRGLRKQKQTDRRVPYTVVLVWSCVFECVSLRMTIVRLQDRMTLMMSTRNRREERR